MLHWWSILFSFTLSSCWDLLTACIRSQLRTIHNNKILWIIHAAIAPLNSLSCAIVYSLFVIIEHLHKEPQPDEARQNERDPLLRSELNIVDDWIFVAMKTCSWFLIFYVPALIFIASNFNYYWLCIDHDTGINIYFFKPTMTIIISITCDTQIHDKYYMTHKYYTTN